MRGRARSAGDEDRYGNGAVCKSHPDTPRSFRPRPCGSMEAACLFSAWRMSIRHHPGFGIGKRLLDYGIHAPTVYFPLIVPAALMFEPTESESKEELDRFVEAMKEIAQEDPDVVHGAPYTTPVKRLDEAKAARKPVLRWHTLDRLEGCPSASACS